MSLVLVADDEPAVLEVLSQVVEDLGHDVLLARDGEEAFGLARAKRPQLVVTDHMMPRLSGLELCRKLKGDQALKDVPVILLSAVLPQGVPEAAAFLHKPFEITDFEAVIRQSLGHVPEQRLSPDAPPVEALGHWMAHTLQGPLAAAREQLQRLQVAPMVDQQVVEALGTHLRYMEFLSRSLQEAARLTAGSVTLHPVSGDLSQHLRRVVEAWQAQAPAVPIQLQGPGEPVELRFDPERIRQVFDGLLANAVHHGGGRGAVRVELTASQSLVTVRVRDEGPGLTDHELPRLFTPFQVRTDDGGTGLGLYIASELARLHGGALSVETQLNKGSTFSLLLPRG
ncbi:hybrid sensor histidine kinase/response regulator [Hyalangium minutum]|uniref:histidine kinase n=1 Tax=Hyalangium minutum TaxID=394096 RepID=A0A085WNT5_9BACT|nr:hybrid sensor histidine kinase/response regulator [Hyalangium minutum]KFE69348.1 Adenylate cyclase [Hyalangium minutum]